MRAYLFLCDFMLGSDGRMPNPWLSFGDVLRGSGGHLFADIVRARSMIAWLDEREIEYSVEFDLQNYGPATEGSCYAYHTMEFFVRPNRYEDLVMLRLAYNDADITE